MASRLACVAPQRFDKLLFAHSNGHPRVDGQPLLLGDRVKFVLPNNWQARDLGLEDLEQLAIAP